MLDAGTLYPVGVLGAKEGGEITEVPALRPAICQVDSGKFRYAGQAVVLVRLRGARSDLAGTQSSSVRFHSHGQVSIIVVPTIPVVQLVVFLAATTTSLPVFFLFVDLRYRHGFGERTAWNRDEQHQEAPCQVEAVADAAQYQKRLELILHAVPITWARLPMRQPS